MPVMILDVPNNAWNEVVLQSVLFGMDYSPDIHKEEGSTLVEICGTEEKLDQLLTRIGKKVKVDKLGIVASKPID